MRLAVFDVDNVLVRGQSQKEFARFLFLKKKIPLGIVTEVFGYLFLYKLGIVRDLDGLRKKSVLFFKGWTVGEMKALCEDFYRSVLKNRIIASSVDLLREHQRVGDTVILVSASLSELLDPLCRDLGVVHAIGLDLEIVQGVYTGCIQGIVPYGQGKEDRLKGSPLMSGADLACSSAYADHSSDVGLLVMFGKPCVINPDRGLLAIARQKGWPVKVF